MGKLTVAAAAATGYVLGTRAGRERYEQIKRQARRVWNDPRVADKRHDAVDLASQKANEAAAAAKQKASEAAAAAKHKAEEVVADARESNPEAAEKIDDAAVKVTEAVHDVKDAAAATPSNVKGDEVRQPAPPQGI
ncbi:hypothetical protein [Solicola sp. PLA-1-18]|uniref:hypothetical protein n=1 Tax=Solicola sp. PLA-1-18 TaxID=3380532 RepID=UPI003B7E23F9